MLDETIYGPFCKLGWRKKIMMRSLYSGVSGLRSSQTKMDVIGNNIANVNTTAFKSSSATFSEVFYQTTQSASGPNATTGAGGQNAIQVGLGTSIGSITTSIENGGAAQRTDNPYDLKLTGSSFFVVNNGGENYFTRAGNFTVDEAGSLVTSNGGSVMGWQVDADGNVVKDQVSALAVKGNKFTYTDPEQTTKTTISGNLNSSDAQFKTSGSVPTSITFFDSLGYQYLATVSIKQTSASKYTMSIDKITCDKVETNLKATINGGASAAIEFNPDTGLCLTNTSNFTIAFATKTAAEMGTTTNYKDVGTKVNDISLDTSGLKTLGDATNFKLTNDGKAVGKMSSVGIDTSGRIVANYTNGDTMTLGQVAVATFSNPSGLEKVGENLYRATLNSGMFDGVGSDVTAVSGSINSGQLEMSNVDLSAEFTEMITTQRGFQASSRIITVSDTMLEELVNLKR